MGCPQVNQQVRQWEGKNAAWFLFKSTTPAEAMCPLLNVMISQGSHARQPCSEFNAVERPTHKECLPIRMQRRTTWSCERTPSSRTRVGLIAYLNRSPCHSAMPPSAIRPWSLVASLHSIAARALAFPYLLWCHDGFAYKLRFLS